MHPPDRIHIAFDDHRLVANAGLILPATWARHLGLPNDVNCTACILEMTGEYPSAEDYGSGYAHGKEKAHFELRTWDGSHAGDCGCEPCQTVRAVIGALSKQPGLNWMMENHASRI